MSSPVPANQGAPSARPSRLRAALVPVMFAATVGVTVWLVFGGRLAREWRDWRERNSPLPEPAQKVQMALPAALPTDWPQWRGWHRDGVSRETNLLANWPAGGPKLLWTAEGLGAGYAAPAVVGGKVFVPGTRGDSEYLFVLDGKTGEPNGEAVIGHLFQNAWGGGPRGTPSIDGDRLYVIGGTGSLICLDLASGDVRWRKRIFSEFGGLLPHWGCGESPLVDGDRVVCTPGGPKGAVVALNKRTGERLWQSAGLTDTAAYSSLVLAECGGVRQYVAMTFQSVAGVAADDGRLLWRYPRDGRNAPVPTPVVNGDYVYATSGYGVGCHLVKVVRQGETFTAEEVYANTNVANHHGGVVRLGERLYGHDDSRGWVCQDFLTGELLWRERRKLPTKGSITSADGKLFCYGEKDGTLVVLEASDKEWKELGRFKIPRETAQPRGSGGIWTHPVIADGKLFLRDQELLFCYDLR